MERRDPELVRVWRQSSIPVIFKRQRPPLLVKMPYAQNNRVWLQTGRGRKVEWNNKFDCWETPAAWFDSLVRHILSRYGKMYVIQLYKEQQKCAPACWRAEGMDCECSCMGAHHGTGHPEGRWYEVSETFAFSSGQTKYACRLLTSPDAALSNAKGVEEVGQKT